MPRATSSAVLLAALLAAACGGSPTRPRPGGGAGRDVHVTVSPREATIGGPGGSVFFRVSVVDGDGKDLPLTGIVWSVSDSSVIHVEKDGVNQARVTALGEGESLLIATDYDAADTAHVTVDPGFGSLRLEPDPVELHGVGDTARVRLIATDANGDTVTDLGYTWEIGPFGSVATVDSTGLVTALSLGKTGVYARLDSADAARAGEAGVATGVYVHPADPPTVDSVSPDPLLEARQATLTGSNFDVLDSLDAVRVDGVVAQVLKATPTSLVVEVPVYDCLPIRDVDVSVATPAGSTSVSRPFEPREPPVDLAAGEQRVVTTSADLCLQFPAAAAGERYLVGVQSLDQTAGTLTSVQIRTRTTGATDTAAAAAVSLMPRATVRSGGSAGSAPASWVDRRRRVETRLRSWERTHLDPAASIPASGGGRSSSPSVRASVASASASVASASASVGVSDSVAVGDTVTLRVPDLSGSDLCADYTEVTGVVKAKGTWAYVVADVEGPGFTDADYRAFSDELDRDIVIGIANYFGGMTDFDDNGRVVVLFSQAVNRGNSDVQGFVFAGDFFPRSACASSDEGEVFYGSVPDPDGTFGDPVDTATAVARAPLVMAHELAHVVQDGRRFADGYSFMSATVAEAQATLAEEVVGYRVTGRTPEQDYGYDVAFNTAGADSVDWFADGFEDLFHYFGFESPTSRIAGAPQQCGWWQADPSPCTGRSLWYGVGWSFLRWVADRYGGGGRYTGAAINNSIIDNSATGPGVVADAAGVSLSRLMAGWSAALYLDDRVPAAETSLGFTSWNLFDVSQHAETTARLQPVVEPFSAWRSSVDVKAGSTGYLILDGGPHPATALDLSAPDGGSLPPSLQIWVVRMQ